MLERAFPFQGTPVAVDAFDPSTARLLAALYLHSQVGIAFSVPGITYWPTVVGGLVASLAIIALTFPLLNRITGPEVARNE